MTARWVPDGNGGWVQDVSLRPDSARWVQAVLLRRDLAKLVQDTPGAVEIVVVGDAVVLRTLDEEILLYCLRWRR